MEIIRLEPGHPKSYFQQVAQLHTAGIHFGVLPLLGERFLTRLYYELARAPQTGVWGVVEANNVLGFIAGCADVTTAYRSVLLKAAAPLLLLAGRSLLSPVVLRKALSLFTYPTRSREHAPVPLEKQPSERHPELLSMAVDQSLRGQGIGKALVLTLEESLRVWGVQGCYWVTTNIAEPGSNGFYQAMGFTPCGTVPHHDLVLQLYKKEIQGGTV